MNPAREEVRADADALREYRLAAGFSTTREAARASGVSGRVLARVERHTGRLIQLDDLQTLAHWYHCAPGELQLPDIDHEDRELDPEALRAARRALGWSLEDLAAASGVNFSSLHHWEAQPPRQEFGYNHVRRVARALGVSPEDITRPRTPPPPS